MFFGKRKRKRTKPENVSMVNWIVIAVIALAFLTNNKKNETAEKPVVNILTNASDSLKSATGANSIEDYQRKIFREDKPSDIALGKGLPAICGQTAKIHYQVFADNAEKPIDEATLDYRLGSLSSPALETALLGMKAGGTRRINVPNNQLPGAVATDTATDHREQKWVNLEVELKTLSPQIPDIGTMPFRIAVAQTGGGRTLTCGHAAHVKLTVWDTGAKNLFSTGEDNLPVGFILGASEVPMGLELGTIGMHVGESRTVIIPPALQRTVSGGDSKLDISLPKDQTALVDIEAVP